MKLRRPVARFIGRPMNRDERQQPLGLQEVAGDVLGLLAVHGDAAVELGELLGGQRGHQRLEEVGEVGVLVEELGGDGGHEVLRGLDLLVVLEDHEAEGVQGAVGGGGLAEVGLAVEHRLVGLVGGVAQRQDLGDVDAVGVAQPALAVQAALAVGGSGQDHRLALEVGQGAPPLLLGALLGDEEGVGVGGLGDLQQGDARGVEQVGAVLGELLAVTGLERLGVVAVLDGVEEVDDAADVLRDHVDRAGEVLHVGVAGVDQLDRGVVAGVGEEQLVHRGHQRGLGEGLGGDRDRPAGAGGGAVVAAVGGEVVARAGRGEEQGAHGEDGGRGTSEGASQGHGSTVGAAGDTSSSPVRAPGAPGGVTARCTQAAASSRSSATRATTIAPAIPLPY